MVLCAGFQSALAARCHGPWVFGNTRYGGGQVRQDSLTAGLAVLLYDHRGFGQNGGEPRLQINP